MALLLAVALALGLLAAVLPTGNLPAAPLQRPPAELRLEPGRPQDPPPERSGAAWQLLRLGPLQVTRRSLELGISGGTLLFTLVHSANLMLLTTPPEQLVWAISWLLAPLGRLGVPVERLGFLLLLALRFLPLVQEELQNLLRALATRAVVLKRLGFKGAGPGAGGGRTVAGQRVAAGRAGGRCPGRPRRPLARPDGAAPGPGRLRPPQWRRHRCAVVTAGVALETR